jgi:TRAP-type transport system periplasmic protein
MKKQIKSTFAIAMVTVLLFVFTSFSFGQTDNVRTFRIVANASGLALEAFQMFGELIEEKSGGTLRPEFFLRGQLGTDDEDLSTGIAEGAYEILMSSDMMSNWVAQDWLGFANVPFAFRDPAHVQAYWRGEIGQEVRERMINQFGVRVLIEDVMVRGARNVTANRAIYSPSDIQGLRFRTPNIPAVVAAWQAAGANVTPVPWGELFGALQTGLVNAQENPLEQIGDLSMYQVQDYLMMTGHQYGIQIAHVQESWWNSLSDEEREIVLEANREAAEFYNTSLESFEAELLARFEEQGMTIIPRDEIDIEAFQDAIIPALLERFGDQWAEGGWETIQALE